MHSPNVRESRHVLVTGLPESVPIDRIDGFFSGFGKLEKGAVRCPEGVTISFCDIRSAQKVRQSDQRLDSIPFRMSYQEATVLKNPISNSCMANRSSTSPHSQEGALPTRRRSISPWREKYDQWELDKPLKARNNARPLNISIPKRNSYPRKEGRGSVSPANRSSPRQGLQGYYVEKLPPSEASFLKKELYEEFKDFGIIADTVIEDLNGGERRGLLIFNNLKELPQKHAMIMGQRCHVKQADPVEVQVAYSKTVASKAGIAASLNRDGSMRSPEEYSVFSDKVSRTLYVGCLQSNPTEQSLRRTFDRFGTILEVDVKNPESQSPFAFLHFTDMESTVKAVNYYQTLAMNSPFNGKKQSQKQIKVHFGRSQPTTKLWVGSFPAGVPEDFIRSRLKGMAEGSTEAIYDATGRHAVLRFDTLEHALRFHTGIKNQTIVLQYDGQDFRLSCDYATETLLTYFREKAVKGPGPSSSYLSPPPNPPADMPGFSRYDEKKGAPRRRSKSRERGGRRSRSGSRKGHSRKQSRRKTKSSSEESSGSSASGSTVASRSPSSSASRSESPVPRQKQSQARKKSKSPKRSISVEKRKPQQPAQRSVEPPPGERAASGDSGYRFEEGRPLEPPPAPPPLAKRRPSPPPAPPRGPPPPPPVRLKPQPPSAPYNQQFMPQPPHQGPLLVSGVSPLMTIPPPGKGERMPSVHRPKEDPHHPVYPGTSGEREQQQRPRPPERREERKESIVRGIPADPHHLERMSQERPRPPGAEVVRPSKSHEQLVKKPSVDSNNPYITSRNIPKNLREGYVMPDPRSPYYRAMRPRTGWMVSTVGRFFSHNGEWSIRVPPVELPYEERPDKKIVPKQKHEPEQVHLELRKRSSGSVHSEHRGDIRNESRNESRNDLRRASGGSISRVDSRLESQEEHPPPPPLASPLVAVRVPPTPSLPVFFPTAHVGNDDSNRLKQRSDSAPTWQNQRSMSETPQTPTPASAGLLPFRPETSTPVNSFEDRLAKIRNLQSDPKDAPLKLGALAPQLLEKVLGGTPNTSFPPPPLPANMRPNLHINIPPTGTSFPNTPNSSKSDFSPRVDLTRKVNTAIPTSSARQPFAPGAVHAHSRDQHSSPLLSAPPAPPILPKVDAFSNLKSPPMTPAGMRPQVNSTPSPSVAGRPIDFRAQQTPQTPRTPGFGQQAPPRPVAASASRDAKPEFGSVNPFQKDKEKSQTPTQRHDSMSTLRSPPATTPARSLSVSEHKKSVPQRDTSEYLRGLFGKQPLSLSDLKFGRIARKTDAVHETQFSAPPPKEKEHKKHKEHKEHKLKKKDDGTLETKEERDKRRAKEKEIKKLKKKMERRQMSKEERKKEKEEKKLKKEGKDKSKKEGKESKEKEKLKEKKNKKNKKKKMESTEEETSTSESEQDEAKWKQAVKKDQQSIINTNVTTVKDTSNENLANLIAGGGMYDRLKKRTSIGSNKNTKTKKALKALREKQKAKNAARTSSSPSRVPAPKKRLLISSEDEEEHGNDSSSCEDSEMKKSDSEPEAKEDKVQEKQKKKPKLGRDRHVTSESDSEGEFQTPAKKPKKDKPKTNIFGDSDIFGADSSEDEEVKPPQNRKPKTSTSDESDHPKKKQKIDYHSLFGSDSVDEKKEKKKSQLVAQQKQRKRQPSVTHEESQPKRSKRGSLSSEISVEPKSRETSVKKEDEHHLTSGSEDKQSVYQPESERPKLLTKAAVKVFEPPSTSHQPLQLLEDDSEDSEEAGPAESQTLSSISSDSESESILSPTRSIQHEEEHDDGQSTVATEITEQSQEPLLEPPPAPPEVTAPTTFQSPVQEYEPTFQEMVKEETIRDLEEEERAAQAICDDQAFEQTGQATIFDDVDPIPEYPSHDFLRADDAVADQAPVEISDEQIMLESFAEEPMPEEEESPEEETPSPTRDLLPAPPLSFQHSSTTPRRSHPDNEFPSPTSLAAHAVAVKSPLSVAVDGPSPAPMRAPSVQLFSPTATHSSNEDPLTSPFRAASHTPMSVVQQSPLVSPAISAAAPPLRPLEMRNTDFTQSLMAQNAVQQHHARQQFENFYPNNRIPPHLHQQVPLAQTLAPAHQNTIHLNGVASSSVILEHRGVAAVPSPSHVHSGTSSISSPGTPPTFGKESTELYHYCTVRCPISTILLEMSFPNFLPYLPTPFCPPLTTTYPALQEQLDLAAQLSVGNLSSYFQQLIQNLFIQAVIEPEKTLELVKAFLACLLSTPLNNSSLSLVRCLFDVQNHALVAIKLHASIAAEPLKVEPVHVENERKRSAPLESPQPVKKFKLEEFTDGFHDVLDRVLIEEIGRKEEKTPIPPPPPEPTFGDKLHPLEDVLLLNYKPSADSSSSSRGSVSPGSPSSPSAPLSPTFLDQIRNIAETMVDKVEIPSVPFEKMPPVWKGRIVLKNAAETTVQMHYMFGQREYLESAIAHLERMERDEKLLSLRIAQRMKAEGDGLYRMLHRLQAAGATCLCVPIGNNSEEALQSARILKTEFADYFVKKGVAGVIPLEDITPKSHFYVFPPNEFTDHFLQVTSPDLFSRIQNKLTQQFSYLFVAIAPAEH